MSTHNICFYEDLTKIIFELSSNTHLISSAEVALPIHPKVFFLLKLRFEPGSETKRKYHAQLRMNLTLLINVKMQSLLVILTFMSRTNHNWL